MHRCMDGVLHILFQLQDQIFKIPLKWRIFFEKFTILIILWLLPFPYLATIDSLNWPDGITLPDKLEDEDTGASFQVGYGETRASYLWEYSWMKEWLDTYNTDPERAEKALEELEKAFDMPYMGIDRCDDATRNYLRENIDKAKLGDPSGFTESIRANYAN